MSALFAYVDESVRGGRYLLAVVVVPPERAGPLRRQVRHLLLPGQRKLHFKKEGNRRRRMLLVELANLQLDVTVYECQNQMGRNQEDARRSCLARAIQDLQERGNDLSLLIESRGPLDQLDTSTILRARHQTPPLSFEHLAPMDDPLLWLPDTFAWPVGAGGDWLRRVKPALTGGIVVVG